MRKVITLSSPPLPRDQLDKLIEAVCPPDGESNYLEWPVNDSGELDLFEETLNVIIPLFSFWSRN